MKRLVILSFVALMMFAFGAAGGVFWERSRRLPNPQTSIPPDTFITLGKTPGYGPLANYMVAVAADGSVVFNGSYFVDVNGKDQWKKSGIVRGHITEGQLQQLLAEFNRANYFSLQDAYRDARDGCPNYATDQPRVFTSIQINGRKKSIDHYLGCLYDGSRDEIYPRELATLEKSIADIVNVKQWMQ